MSPRARFFVIAAVRVLSALMLAMAGYLLVTRGVETRTLTAAAPLIGAGLVGVLLVVPSLTRAWRSPGERE